MVCIRNRWKSNWVNGRSEVAEHDHIPGQNPSNPEKEVEHVNVMYNLQFSSNILSNLFVAAPVEPNIKEAPLK